MIIIEEQDINGKLFIRTYSDEGKVIRKIGTDELYDEAYDPIEFKDIRKYEEYTYVEPIVEEEQLSGDLSSEIPLEENTEEMI